MSENFWFDRPNGFWHRTFSVADESLTHGNPLVPVFRA